MEACAPAFPNPDMRAEQNTGALPIPVCLTVLSQVHGLSQHLSRRHKALQPAVWPDDVRGAEGSPQGGQ